MNSTWQNFFRGGLSNLLDGNQPQQASKSNTPAQNTPNANAQPSQTVHASTAGLWTHQDTILAATAGVLVVVLMAIRKH